MRRVFLFIFGLIFAANFVCGFALTELLVRLLAPRQFVWFLYGFLILQSLGLLVMMGARAFGRQPGTGLGRTLLSFLMIWNMLLALPTATASTVWLIVWKIITWQSASVTLDPASRFIGLVATAFPFALAVLASAVARWQLDHFRVKRVTLKIPDLPPALRGFTVVHLSDLHIGKLTRGKVLTDIVAASNQLNADVIVFTGDLINMSLEDLPSALDLLRGLKSRHGLYLCEGNHDLIENGARFEADAAASGLGFLFNAVAHFSVRGQEVQVLGLRWGEAMSAGSDAVGVAAGDTIKTLRDEGSAGAFPMLLGHHPDVFDAAVAAGIPLTFAGHTHGGQLNLTSSIGFGPALYRYWSGLYRRGASQLIVSNGAGNWFPLRMGAPAEIIHVTLE